VIEIEKSANYIWARAPYDEDAARKLREIGGRWLPAKKLRKFPLDFSICLQLRAAFGEELDVGPKLTAWARTEKARLAGIRELAKSNSAAIGMVAKASPVLADAMASRTYQTVGAAWMAATRYAILGDQPGLGKTLQTMGAVVEAGLRGPILVFAPKTAALTTWPDELDRWLPNDGYTVVSHLPGNKRRDELGRFMADLADGLVTGARHWFICNMDMARIKIPRDPRDHTKAMKDAKGKTIKQMAYPHLFDIPWQAIVCDESHQALVTHSAFLKDHTQVRAGLASIKLPPHGLRIALSGTPYRGKIENLWGTLNWLRPDLYKSYWKWIERWFVVYDSHEEGRIIDGIDESKLDEFADEMATLMLRRTKDEVVPDLPPKLYAGKALDGQNKQYQPGIWLDLTAVQKRMYKQLKTHGAVTTDGGTMMANGALAEMMRAKQIASSAGNYTNDEWEPCLPSNKFDWLVEFLSDLGIERSSSGTGKVIVASQSTKLVNLFAHELMHLGIPSFRITGQVTPRERQRQVHEFQSDQNHTRVFFLNTDAGGVSLTLDAADYVVMLDEKWIPDDQEQVEDRAHRVSRMHNVTIYYLRSKGTIEEHICRVNGDREEIQKMLMDGTRGVSFAKQLLNGE